MRVPWRPWTAPSRTACCRRRVRSTPSAAASFWASISVRRLSSRRLGATPYCSSSQAVSSAFAPPACCSRAAPHLLDVLAGDGHAGVLGRLVQHPVEDHAVQGVAGEAAGAGDDLRVLGVVRAGRPLRRAHLVHPALQLRDVIRCPPTTAAAPGWASFPQAVRSGAAATIAAERRARCDGGGARKPPEEIVRRCTKSCGDRCRQWPALAKPFDQRFTATSGTASRSAAVASASRSARDGHRSVPGVAVHGDRVAAARLLAVDHVLVAAAVAGELGRRRTASPRWWCSACPTARTRGCPAGRCCRLGAGDRLRAGAGEAVVAGAVASWRAVPCRRRARRSSTASLHALFVMSYDSMSR